MIKAAIDIGTNSTRLIVGEIEDTGYKTLHREARVTRLGQGVDKTHQLADEAINRTISVIADYKKIAVSFDAKSIRVGTTSAARDAKNSDKLVKRAKDLTGLTIEILPPEKEAELSFKGATSSFFPIDPYQLQATSYQLIMDIGGGSTELILGNQGGIILSYSKNIGCVRLTEKFAKHDPLTPKEVENIRQYVRDIYSREVSEIKSKGKFSLIGVAGTITTLSAIKLGLSKYDPTKVHGSTLKDQDITKTLNLFLSMDMAGRKEIPVMESGRADVIVAGTVIASELVNMLGVSELTVSESDILDGLLLDENSN